MELNSTFPSRLFPLPLGVSRDAKTAATTFAYEYPISPSSVSSLQTKLSGNTLLLPLRSFLYSGHESSRRVLAHALRHYPNVIKLWCSQFGQAYRALQHFPHILYRFNKSRTYIPSEALSDYSNTVCELVNSDVFVREDGSLVLSKAIVTVDEDAVNQSPKAPRNTDPLVEVTTELLCESLCISRSLTVIMDSTERQRDDQDDIAQDVPDYTKEIDSNNSDFNELTGDEWVNDNTTSCAVYLAEHCGLDIFPNFRSSKRQPVSTSSNFVLFTEANEPSRVESSEALSKNGGKGSSLLSSQSQSRTNLPSRGNGGSSRKKVLDSILATNTNLLVTMTADDEKIVSVVSINGYDSADGKTNRDAQGNSTYTFPGRRNNCMSMRPRKGFNFRVKAKSPGIAYMTISQSTKVDKSSDVISSALVDVVHSVTLKICVIDFPISKSSEVCEVISLSEAAFWTPLYKPIALSPIGVHDSTANRSKVLGSDVNCTTYLDRIFSAQAFKTRVCGVSCYFLLCATLVLTHLRYYDVIFFVVE